MMDINEQGRTFMDLGALTNDHVNIIKDEFDHPELWGAFQEIADSDYIASVCAIHV